jgi:hypothetical protein
MSTQDWNWLYDFCLRHKDSAGKPDPLRFVPGKAEPWVEYRVISELTQCATSTVETKAKRVAKHPSFAGFVRFSDFESVHDGEEAK